MTIHSQVHPDLVPVVGLDRIVISPVFNPNYYEGKGEQKIRPADHEWFEYMLSSLNASDHIKCVKKYEKVSKGGKPSPSKYLLKDKYGRILMDIMWGNNYGKPYFLIGLNPGKLLEYDLSLIAPEISSLIPPDESFADHLLRWELSHLELCIDLPGIESSDVTVLAMGNQTHTKFEETTEYNGSRNSRNGVVKYDKRKKTLDKTGVDIGHALTRVEVRANERRLSVRDFLEMGEADFYKKTFRLLLLRLQCTMQVHGIAHTGQYGQLLGEGCAPTTSFSLQDQESLLTKASGPLLVRPRNTLDRAKKPATELYH